MPRDLAETLAFDIFIADGGVDDFELRTDDELRTIIREALDELAPDVLAAVKTEILRRNT
jgi:hypothetical protein